VKRIAIHKAGEEVVLNRRGKAQRAAAVKRIRALSKKLNLKISPAELRKAIAAGRA
jgi:hypothetical protein